MEETKKTFHAAEAKNQKSGVADKKRLRLYCSIPPVPALPESKKNCTDDTFYLDSTPVTDDGYLLKEKEFEEMFESGRKSCTATSIKGMLRHFF